MQLSLLPQSEKVTFEEFHEWLLQHPEATSLTRWLLSEPSSVTLSNDLETPTFYQTLAGVTHRECHLSLLMQCASWGWFPSLERHEMLLCSTAWSNLWNRAASYPFCLVEFPFDTEASSTNHRWLHALHMGCNTKVAKHLRVSAMYNSLSLDVSLSVGCFQ